MVTTWLLTLPVVCRKCGMVKPGNPQSMICHECSKKEEK